MTNGSNGNKNSIRRFCKKLKGWLLWPSYAIHKSIDRLLHSLMRLNNKLKSWFAPIVMFIIGLLVLSFFYEGFERFQDITIGKIISAITGWLLIDKYMISKKGVVKTYRKVFSNSIFDIIAELQTGTPDGLQLSLKNVYRTVNELGKLSKNEDIKLKFDEMNKVVNAAVESGDLNRIIETLESYNEEVDAIIENFVDI